MATFNEYLSLAQDVYARAAAGEPDIGSWRRQKWEWATWYGDGFQGGIFVNDNEVVAAFSGTKGSPGTAPISQTSANIRIGVNVIPNMAGSAFAMVNWAKEYFALGRPISIVGHSLGGGLAQVVGNWSGCPFVSFNGPGMNSHLKMSAFNIFKPRQMYRSAVSRNTADTIGICFYIKTDFTGTFGAPVGYAVGLDKPQSSQAHAHSLDALEAALRLKGWLDKKPRDVYSIWPK